ncbi:hypothetical protein L208DRAFT_1131565, partial [Tricholoma matsutake]
LQKGVIPIFPTERTFGVQHQNGRKTKVTRRQFTFTDYKAQGQTLEQVVGDLAKPPTGNITPFGAYVALLQSRGRDTIRLLRDFNNTLLMTHPLEMLYEEDHRLEKTEKE